MVCRIVVFMCFLEPLETQVIAGALEGGHLLIPFMREWSGKTSSRLSYKNQDDDYRHYLCCFFWYRGSTFKQECMFHNCQTTKQARSSASQSHLQMAARIEVS